MRTNSASRPGPANPSRRRFARSTRAFRCANLLAQLPGHTVVEVYPAAHGWCVKGSQVYDEAAAEIGQVVEGLITAPVLRNLSHRLRVELPITESVCSVLGGSSLTELAAGLMGRKPTDE